jgi:ferredoxin
MKKNNHRLVVQSLFLAFVLAAVFIFRGHAEAWCPFGGVETIYSYVKTGQMVCSLAVSNIYILISVLLLTLLLRRVFCGYACPIGAISTLLRKGAGKLGIKQLHVTGKVDRALRLLKYVVLAVILYITWTHTELYFRTADPCYAIISRHGEDITVFAYIVLGLIILASLFIMMPFCRWFCPLAAVMNPISRFGVGRIKRDTDVCIDCGKCTRICPMEIDVANLKTVKDASCMSCGDCIEGCPVKDKGALKLNFIKTIPHPRTVAVIVMIALFAGAVLAVNFFDIPSYIHVHKDPQGHGELKTLEMNVTGVNCNGSAMLLVFFLERDDIYELPGYFKVEAWPSPNTAKVRVHYDPEKADETMIYEAITEAYYDPVDERWRVSPYQIEGYDPLMLE